MNTQAILERFILDDLLQGSSRKTIGLDDSLVNSGVIDSLGILRLISFLESEFGMTIGDGEVSPDNFENLRKIIEFVERKNAHSSGQP